MEILIILPFIFLLLSILVISWADQCPQPPPKIPTPLESAYLEGIAGYWYGANNPYNSNQPELLNAWNSGWNDAMENRNNDR